MAPTRLGTSKSSHRTFETLAGQVKTWSLVTFVFNTLDLAQGYRTFYGRNLPMFVFVDVMPLQPMLILRVRPEPT